MSDNGVALKIFSMKDNSESVHIKKGMSFDMPFRLLVVGKSQLSGKTTVIGNLVLRPTDIKDVSGRDFYFNDFDGNDIYIICPSKDYDKKWTDIIYAKRIPDQNIYNSYNEMELEELYSKLEKDHLSGKRDHKLVIFDDCSFGGSLKEKINGVMAKFACNSRHILISLIITAQKYSDILTTLRENASGMIVFKSSLKQIELIYADVGQSDKKTFLKAYQKTTYEPHTFMVVNYSNPPDKVFLDSNFLPISELNIKQI